MLLTYFNIFDTCLLLNAKFRFQSIQILSLNRRFWTSLQATLFHAQSPCIKPLSHVILTL